MNVEGESIRGSQVWELLLGIIAAISHVSSIFPPAIMEIMAMAYSLQWAKNISYDNLIVEGENLKLMRVLAGGEMDYFSELGSLVADCFHLKSLFGNVIFNRVFRGANEMAHELARYAQEVDVEAVVWKSYLIF